MKDLWRKSSEVVGEAEDLNFKACVLQKQLLPHKKKDEVILSFVLPKVTVARMNSSMGVLPFIFLLFVQPKGPFRPADSLNPTSSAAWLFVCKIQIKEDNNSIWGSTEQYVLYAV